MGLDTVELAMEVEESFGITIPDVRASEIRTVGDLYSFVLEETRDRTRHPSKCLSAATFYALRRHLSSMIDEAPSIRPQTLVDKSLPRRKRRVLWRQLQNEMDLRFPRLCRPSWITLLACISVVFVPVGILSWLSPYVGGKLVVFVAILAVLFYSALLAVATSPIAILPSATFTTYRGLVTQLMALNYEKLSERHASWNPTDVWSILQLIIVEQLGVSKEDVTPNASFISDLGAD